MSVGVDASCAQGGENSLFPMQIHWVIQVDNYTDSILTVTAINWPYLQEDKRRSGYFQWIMDGDTLDLDSRVYDIIEPTRDSVIVGVSGILTMDSLMRSRFKIKDRNDTLEIKRNLESLIQQSRMRFVPIPEDYVDIPEGHTIIRSPMEIDMSSFYIYYLLGGSGYLHLEYNNGKLHYKGWDPSSAHDI